METKIKDILNQWLKPGERVLLGISGGADSVALAHIVDTLGYQMELVHINFHLRGKESDHDEAFVSLLCKKHFARHHLQKFSVDTIGYAKEKGISIEMAARDLRYDIFKKTAERKKIKWILVGHHADDQIETALLNLSRGTGGKGMAGMQIGSEQNILRPMLGVWRKEIVAYLDKHGYEYCTDSTNIDTKYKRNLIRHKVIPLLEKLNPSFKESMLRSMEYFREEQEVLDYFSEDCFQKVCDIKSQVIDFGKLQQYPQSKTLLARKLRAMQFSQNQVNNILRYNQNVKCTTYSNNDDTTHLQIYRGLGFLYPTGITKPLPLNHLSAGIHDLENVGTLSIGGLEGTLRVNHEVLKKGKVTFRTADKSDRFQPFGMKKGSKKLFRYLGEKGIPEYYREWWPVLCNEREVIAILPFEVSENAKAIPHKASINISFYPLENTLGEVIKLFDK